MTNLECVPITAASMENVQVTSVVEPTISNNNTQTLEPITVAQALDLMTSNLGSQTMEPMTSGTQTLEPITSDAQTLEPITVAQALDLMTSNLGSQTMEPITSGTQTLEPITSDAQTLEPITVARALDLMTSNLSTQTLEPMTSNDVTPTLHPVMTTQETQMPKPKITMCDKGVQTDDTDFFSETSFLSDDAKVQYYTGLSSYLLLKTFELVMSPFVHGDKRSYYWRCFLVVLLKLKLNLGFQDIAYRMGISKATVSRQFHETLDVMYTRLEWLIKWPERAELQKTMPNCFRATYGTKVVAIVDCYEIKVETPSHMVAKAATWSQYKHANTAKVFIAMCPQGVTTFISQTWGGRVSDKLLTVNSGFLNKLLPGDIVLADRGFDIEEDVARMRATLKIPAFTRGCTQLSPVDIEETRKLANLRIHIERVIGATLQKYSILMSCMPINFLKTNCSNDKPPIDKIVLVCSALNNLSISVVPKD